MTDQKTHFGYQTVNESEKAGKVAQVFHSVAKNYDIMNDVMSGGLHRVWKHFTINTARVPQGGKVLDIAGGTGDLSRGWAKRVGKEGEVWLLADEGYQIYYGEYNFVFVNAEKSCRHIVLRNASDEDMEIYCHLDRYFEETGKYHIQNPQR